MNWQRRVGIGISIVWTLLSLAISTGVGAAFFLISMIPIAIAWTIVWALSGRAPKQTRQVELPLRLFAAYPISLLTQGQEPFDSWRPPAVFFAEKLVGTFKGVTIGYQLFIFYALVTKRYGFEIAEAMLRLQGELLDEVGSDGRVHTGMIRQISQQASDYKPVTAEGFEAPFEWHLAICALSVWSDAFPASGAAVPDYGDADVALAECLIFARDKALTAFSAALDAVKLTLD